MNVSLVIHATQEDAPILATMLPHIVRQARFTFAERVVTVEADSGELRRILSEAIAAKIIDRVVELPTDAQRRREIQARYVGAASPGLPGAGRAITARLVGLEAARTDLVAWCAADVLVHAWGAGWVGAGVQALESDDSVWLASMRGGPAGDKRPLSSRWRDLLSPPSRITASHFVCDRRRLHNKLRWVDADEPSGYLRDALERHGAVVAIVDGGWHIRPRTHRQPLGQWIERLVAAVERGDVPELQRDQWLRLDDPTQRSAWRSRLFTTGETDADRARPVARLLERGSAGALPISIVIPIRNRAGVDVERTLASLSWQRGGRPREVILVSHGSDPQIEAELRALAVSAGATLIAVGAPTDPWCKGLALNTGILATDPSVPYVMTMDADMILAETMLETVLAELAADPERIVLCRSSDLPEGCAIPAQPGAILAAFEELRALANLRGEFGTGGIQAMRRSFLVDVRGYDEDMLWWGALDTDLVRRAESRGMRASWVTERTAMLHQWHPRKHRILDDANADDARDSWLRNHELMLERTSRVVRNQGGWGASLRPARW